MRHPASILVLSVAMLVAAPAVPCGGGFGEELEINPSQTIILRHVDGQETYVFNPNFCGAAAEFGLILPVPSELSATPSLTDIGLYAQLDDLIAPEVVEEEACRSKRGMDAGDDNSRSDTAGGGVDVVDSGQVGIFDWTLLQADAVEAFTDWLDVNQYPYEDTSVEHFTHYVEQSWYFIAFKVTAAEAAPTDGSLLCGTFGPIQLAFPAAEPVVPARIAAAGSAEYEGLYWQIHVFAATPVAVSSNVDWNKLRYAGVLTDAQAREFPAVAAFSKIGEQLTTIDVRFNGSVIEEDLTFSAGDGPTSFRETITQTRWVDCAESGRGCNVVNPGEHMNWILLAAAVSILVLWRRRRSKSFSESKSK